MLTAIKRHFWVLAADAAGLGLLLALLGGVSHQIMITGVIVAIPAAFLAILLTD